MWEATGRSHYFVVEYELTTYPWPVQTSETGSVQYTHRRVSLINLPTKTPTSFIYFAAAGIAAYFSDEVAPLRWLAYSAAMMFVVRGPLQYFQDGLEALYENAGRDFRALLRASAILVLVGEWMCYGLVGYWVYRFALAI